MDNEPVLSLVNDGTPTVLATVEAKATEVLDTAEAKAARLTNALNDPSTLSAIHGCLLEVLDAVGGIRNGLAAGETKFEAELAHAEAAFAAAKAKLLG
jgi:hypothetical protein